MQKRDLKDFLKNIFTNPNKNQTQQYSSSAISFSSGSSFLVTEGNAWKIPEFIAAIDLISNDIASSLFLEANVKYQGKMEYYEVVENSSWNYLLNRAPNEWQSSFEFWKNNFWNYFIRGAFFFFINKDEQGRPIELIPIHPNSNVKIKDKDGNYAYELTLFDSNAANKPQTMIIPYKSVFSMFPFDFENITDLNHRSVFSSVLEQLGLRNQYDLIALNQSARIMAHIKSPDNLTDKQKEDIKSSFKAFSDGAKKLDSSAVLITDPRISVELLGNEKSQIKSALEPEFVKSIMVKLANIFHIPLPKLNISDSGMSQYKSREDMNIDYMSEAVAPLLKKITSKLTAITFTKSNKVFTYDFSKLMEVDAATRAEFSSKMRQNGIMTTNELRILNDLLPIADGDKIFGNGTLVELGKDPKNTTPINEKGGENK